MRKESVKKTGARKPARSVTEDNEVTKKPEK
jgi:hypothetical protein